jgi:hypothetical protein
MRLVNQEHKVYPNYPVKIKNYNPPYNTCKSNRPSFGLLSTEGDRCVYGATTCKDYILDYTHAAMKGISFAIGGLGSANIPASINEVRLLVADWEGYIPAAVDFLNQVETALDIPHSIPFKVDLGARTDTNGYVFRGSSRWLIAPPMFSLYGLFICGAERHKVGVSYQETLDILSKKPNLNNYYELYEHSIWGPSVPRIKQLIKCGDRAIFGQDPKLNWCRKGVAKAGIHSCGIMAWGTNYLGPHLPDYYYFLPGK